MSGQTVSILWAEDDAYFARQILDAMRDMVDEGWRVVWALSFREAVQHLELTHYDVVVVDARLSPLPTEAGEILLQKAKEKGILVRALLTGEAERAVVGRAYDSVHVYEKPTPMPEWTAKVIDIFRQLAAEAGRLKQRSWDVRTWSLRSVMDLHEVALRLLKVPCHEGYAFVGGAAAAAATTTAEMTRWQQHLEQWNQLVDVMEKQSWGDLAVGKGSPPVGVRLCDHPELGSAWVAIRELLHDGLTEAIGQYSRNLTFQEVPLARYLLKELGIDLVSLPTPQEMRRYFRTLREVLLNRVIRGALVTAVEIVDTATRVASTEQVWSRTGLRLAVDSALSDLEHLKGYCVGRPDELESWLWALVINSAEAGASRLWLRGKPLHVPDIGYVVCLSVADDGQGIPLSNLERLPATKRGHTGTSLRQILETVNAIRGALEVASLTPGGEAAVRHSAASGTTVRPSAWNSWPGHAGQGTIVRIMLPYYPGLLDQPKEQL